MMLVRSFNSDKLSNRVVHISVQLFSNEALALKMTEYHSLLHIMVTSLKNMMADVLIPSDHGDGDSGTSSYLVKHTTSWLNDVFFIFILCCRLLTVPSM